VIIPIRGTGERGGREKNDFSFFAIVAVTTVHFFWFYHTLAGNCGSEKKRKKRKPGENVIIIIRCSPPFPPFTEEMEHSVSLEWADL